jgi:DNA repair photolyase
MNDEKTFTGQVIYEPRGKAREYSPLAANLYKGCGHKCTYCYAPGATRTSREQFGEPEPRLNIIDKLIKDVQSMRGDPRRILLSFTTDPYQPIDEKLLLTRYALRLMTDAGLAVNILTKGGVRSTRDFDLLKLNPENRYGCTLTYIDDEDSLAAEPNAALPGERISALRQAHDAGIFTWVSLEPLLDLAQAAKLLIYAADCVDLVKIGKLNHADQPYTGIEFTSFLRWAISFLRKKNKDFYIKQDTRPFCGVELRKSEMDMDL